MFANSSSPHSNHYRQRMQHHARLLTARWSGRRSNSSTREVTPTRVTSVCGASKTYHSPPEKTTLWEDKPSEHQARGRKATYFLD
eukprot:14037087-Heterocapsa_arctica.AAC.1